MRDFFILGVIVALTGCASNPVKPLQQHELVTLKDVCVQTNEKVIVPAFESYIRDGFARHNIKAHFYKDSLPEMCDTKLTYTALRSWDMATYLSVIKLDLYSNSGELLAKIDWEQNPLALNKWRNSEGKVFDAIDQLLGKNKINKNE